MRAENLSSGTIWRFEQLTGYFNFCDGLIILPINLAGVFSAILQHSGFDSQATISLHVLADFVDFSILFGPLKVNYIELILQLFAQSITPKKGI